MFFFISLMSCSLMAQGNDKGPEFSAKFGKGIRFKSADKTLSLKFALRFQTLAQGFFDLDADEDATEFDIMIRRARLKFDGYVFKPGIEYKVELGLSNRDIQVKGKDSDYANIILDAYMRFKLYKNLKLRAGQFKTPGNRERVVSSGNLQLVDRSIVNGKFNLDRDAGIMFENKTDLGKLVLKEYLSITAGEGRNRFIKDSGLMYAGRVDILPFGEFSGKGDYVESAIVRETSPKVAIGITYAYNDDAQRSRGQLGDFLYGERDLTNFTADFMFKYQGLSAYGEYSNRNSVDPVTPSDDAQTQVAVYVGEGYNFQAGYMFKGNWEVAGRWSNLTPKMEIAEFADARTDYTIGFSKFIVGHNLKVQGDVTYSDVQALSSSRSDGQTVTVRLTTNMNF